MIINEVRHELQKISGIKRLSILRPQGGPAGDDIVIGVVSDDIDLIRSMSDEIRNYLRRISGVRDVQHDQ